MDEMATRLAVIADRFCAQSPDFAAEIEASLDDRAWPELRQHSHKLLGRAAMLGFRDIGAAAGAVEAAIDAGATEAEIFHATGELLQSLHMLRSAKEAAFGIQPTLNS